MPSTRAYFKESLQLQRERKNFRPPNILKFPVKKCLILQNFLQPFSLFIVIYKKMSISSTKNSHDHFLLISSISYVSALPNAAGTTAQTNFLHHSFHAFQHSFLFSILFYKFPLFQFKIYNYYCTNPILQLHKLSSVAR